MSKQHIMENHAVPTASDKVPGRPPHSDPRAGRLLDAQRGIGGRWAELVGKPHPAAIRLNVGVRFLPNKHSGIDYQIRGVVDVPDSPYGDDERMYLAKVLLNSAKLPRRKREFAVLSWEATDGGNGVRVEKCAPAPVSTDNDILDAEIFTPPDIEETSDGDSISDRQHNEWVREYVGNRYCRFEIREELHQRLQDIWVNTQVLTPSGRMGLTTDENWYRMLQHVITEMHLRGEPPTPSNEHPHVPEARPFFDGEICRKAASIVAARRAADDVLVKYGKREHMEALFRKGEVYLSSATSYNESAHNQAVRDDELAIELKGGHMRATHPMQFYDKARPAPHTTLNEGDVFRLVFELPELATDQYATMTIQMATDYWMFCIADVLDQRLFADFQADCCLIIRRKPFVERMLRAAAYQLPNANRHFGRVQYVDPLGAWPGGARLSLSSPIYMSKLFRYAYQREFRLAFLPKMFQKRLKPRILQIGPIADIAELLPLPDHDGLCE